MTVERGYALHSRFDDEEMYGVWRFAPVFDDDSAQREWAANLVLRPLDATKWPTPDVIWQSDNHVVQPTTFGFLYQMLVARLDDVSTAIKDLLDPWGQWLPLGGDGAGFSVYMPSTWINHDQDRTTYDGYSTMFYAAEVLSIAEHDLPSEAGCVYLNFFGTCWFERSDDLRRAVIESGATGLGFLRYWDRTGTCRVPGVIARSIDPQWE